MTEDFLWECMIEEMEERILEEERWWEFCNSSDLDFDLEDDPDWNQAEVYDSEPVDYHESYDEWLKNRHRKRGDTIVIQTELPEDEYCEFCGRSYMNCDCDREEE